MNCTAYSCSYKPSCSWFWVVFKPLRNTKSFFRRDEGPQQGALNIVTSFSLEGTSSFLCNSCFAHFGLQNMNLGDDTLERSKLEVERGGKRRDVEERGVYRTKTIPTICASPSPHPHGQEAKLHLNTQDRRMATESSA